MSGIDLFFKTAIDYERTHQLALLTILKETSLPSLLYPFIGEIKVDWEPERGLFDLAVSDAETTLYFELKMWSTLTENQRNRQIAFLKSNNSTCNYVLLGSTWFEFSEEKIHRESEKRAKKIGYEELEKLLNTLLTERGYSPDVYDLILAYRNALVDQFERQLDGWQSQVQGRWFYYALYYQIQKKLSGINSEIYTVNNAGGPVYILFDCSSMKTFEIDGISGGIYFELVNSHLCIKFHTDATDDGKYKLRDRLRKTVHEVLGCQYAIMDKGRIGKYMTACQIDHDFSDINNLNSSIELYQDIHQRFQAVYDHFTA